jgi:DNA-binding beta-propeller fold protein YncE
LRTTAALAAGAWLAGLAFAAGTAQAKVYFSVLFAQGGNGIERAAFDGSALELLQFQPVGFADGVAVDVRDGKIFWTDTIASVIWRANLNGTEAQIVVADLGAEPLGIALDLAHGQMYWTDAEGIKRARLDGSGQELLTKEHARGFIALDVAASRMYWADWPTGAIKTGAMSREPTLKTLISNQQSPFGVAIDPAAGKIYWLQLNLHRSKAERETIRRANLDGTGVQTLTERPGAGFEGGLAIDPGAGKLYWSEAEAHDVAVANLDGSNVRTLFSTGLDSPVGLAIETSDPRPVNTRAPRIEGSAVVGNAVSCNPGAWAGTGPITLAYQWSTAGGPPSEWASSPTYVPAAGQAGQLLTCSVSATDDIATSSATSAAVTVAPAASPVHPRAPLIAGIAITRLTSRGTRAHVPVFTSLAGWTTLRAIPTRWPGGALGRRRGVRRSHRPPTRTTSEMLAAGRATITLHKLDPGSTYRLALVIHSADGQTAKDAATLRVRAR